MSALKQRSGRIYERPQAAKRQDIYERSEIAP